MREAGLEPARSRLRGFLRPLRLPFRHSRRRFKLPMTRSDIADYLGLTIETVSRTLTRLRAEGMIEIMSQSELAIRDGAALEGLAGGLR